MSAAVVIPFEPIAEVNEREPKYTLDGRIKQTHSNKLTGISSEVYAFKNQEEINSMMDIYDSDIEKADCYWSEYAARRNKLLFVLGINIGIRASDIVDLKWSFFFNEELKWNDMYILRPKKTKTKFVKLFFNDAVRSAVEDFVSHYPILDLDDYVFVSRQGDGHITTNCLWQSIKRTAERAGIKQNIGTHSLRKTFGYWIWHNSEDKEKSLIILQSIFNHSSSAITRRYIGILDDDIEDVFSTLNLGRAI